MRLKLLHIREAGSLKSYFVNPGHITHIEAQTTPGKEYLEVRFTGNEHALRLTGNLARELYTNLLALL
jgi:hypothetical protein